VGVVKRRVLQGLWRRLVGVGIIGTGLSGSGFYNSLGRAFRLLPFARPLVLPPRSVAQGRRWRDHDYPRCAAHS
jgi:hypothetical protein